MLPAHQPADPLATGLDSSQRRRLRHALSDASSTLSWSPRISPADKGRRPGVAGAVVLRGSGAGLPATCSAPLRRYGPPSTRPGWKRPSSDAWRGKSCALRAGTSAAWSPGCDGDTPTPGARSPARS
ncbi:hypothetical protein ACPA9J_12965 [Pseudomonas aeruginosa]